ncbi:hypothetical protein BJ912DRAFT_1014344 [Pholiota molesta]|nr:hypothetical protein BJ912DRAFT_1014344 [Pholiota molesta]
MPPLPNPLETIVRNVFLFPADGAEPRIVPGTFSEAASKANPVSFFTRSVDLRSHYGKQITSTFCKFVTNNHPLALERDKGEYLIYSNVSPDLPLNLSAARVTGIDPVAFAAKVFWRGDIVMVKAEDWPGPLVVNGGNHKLYHDIHPSIQGLAEAALQRMYEGNELRQFIREQVEMQQSGVQNDRMVRGVMQINHPHIPLSMVGPLDLKKRSKAIHLWRKISRYYGETDIEIMSRKVCALCRTSDEPGLKVCSGCRQIAYCSRECQKADWGYHKRECKVKQAT